MAKPLTITWPFAESVPLARFNQLTEKQKGRVEEVVRWTIEEIMREQGGSACQSMAASLALAEAEQRRRRLLQVPRPARQCRHLQLVWNEVSKGPHTAVRGQ